MAGCVHMMNSNLDSHLCCVAFEDARLMQCNFYCILKRDIIHTRPLLVHSCTYTAYVLIVIFKSTVHRQLFNENFTQIQTQSGFDKST